MARKPAAVYRLLPAILLSGIPDLEADRLAGKRTVPVRLGLERTQWLVLVLIIAAPLAVLLLKEPRSKPFISSVPPAASVKHKRKLIWISLQPDRENRVCFF